MSSELPLKDYGGVFPVDGEAIDQQATHLYRRANRWATKLFHRGQYYDAEDWHGQYARAQ